MSERPTFANQSSGARRLQTATALLDAAREERWQARQEEFDTRIAGHAAANANAVSAFRDAHPLTEAERQVFRRFTKAAIAEFDGDWPRILTELLK